MDVYIGDRTMNSSLTPAQRALLEAELVRRHHELQAQAAAEGASRVEQAAELLRDDPDAPREHEGDREVALERADRLLVEERELGDALLRLRAGEYGDCADCGATIPFDRLKAQPSARRCVACQQRREHGA